MAKNGLLVIRDLYEEQSLAKMANSGRIHERLEQNSNEMTEKATLKIKGKFLPKIVNLTKANQNV